MVAFFPKSFYHVEIHDGNWQERESNSSLNKTPDYSETFAHVGRQSQLTRPQVSVSQSLQVSRFGFYWYLSPCFLFGSSVLLLLWVLRVSPVLWSCDLLMSTCVASPAAVALQFSLKLAFRFQPRGFFGIAAAQRFWFNSSISKKN